jgi:hypothetical protein
MKPIILLLFFSINLCCFQKMNAQSFEAGFIIGSNFAELEGNGITDYMGWNTGIFGSYHLNRSFQLTTEILYSQNGEYVLPSYYPAADYGPIRLHYLEIPLHIDYRISVFKKEKFQDWMFSLGIAYVNLLDHYAENSEGTNLTNFIEYQDRDNILMQAGTNFFFTKKIALNLRASLPVDHRYLGWTLAGRLQFYI